MKFIYQYGTRWQETEVTWPTVDCGLIPNPFRRGTPDTICRARIRKSQHFEGLVAEGLRLLETNDNIAVCCEYGKHRSVEVAKEIKTRYPGPVHVSYQRKRDETCR